MKVTIIGEKYSNNLGDVIICDTVRFLIQQILPYAEITDADINGRNTYTDISRIDFSLLLKNKLTIQGGKNYRLRNWIKWIIFEKRRLTQFYDTAISQSDVVILAGGQLLMDNNFHYPLRISLLVNLAQKQNIPFIVNSCGTETYRRKTIGAALLSRALKSKTVQYISTRDNLANIYYYIGKTKKKVTRVTPDPAVCAEECYRISKATANQLVGLNIIAPTAYLAYYTRTGDNTYYVDFNMLMEFWINVITQLENHGKPWCIITTGAPLDYCFAVKVLERITMRDRVTKKEVIHPTSPIELLNSLAACSALIGQRLHSLILSYSIGIPYVGIVWDNKIRNFFDLAQNHSYININSYPTPEVAAIDTLRFVKSYQEYDNNILKSQYREHLKTVIDGVVT